MSGISELALDTPRLWRTSGEMLGWPALQLHAAQEPCGSRHRRPPAPSAIQWRSLPRLQLFDAHIKIRSRHKLCVCALLLNKNARAPTPRSASKTAQPHTASKYERNCLNSTTHLAAASPCCTSTATFSSILPVCLSVFCRVLCFHVVFSAKWFSSEAGT